VKSSGTVDAGGTKVLLRHHKDRIVLSKCYERKILVYVVLVMFNTCWQKNYTTHKITVAAINLQRTNYTYTRRNILPLSDEQFWWFLKGLGTSVSFHFS